ALAAAGAGASVVTAGDRSEGAPRPAERSPPPHGPPARRRLPRAQALEGPGRPRGLGAGLGGGGAGPPPLLQTTKELKQGARGYRKLARLAAALVEPSGFLFLASCSHNMPVEEFERQVARGLVDARREGRILRSAGAAADHPVHPALPESGYLKSV